MRGAHYEARRASGRRDWQTSSLMQIIRIVNYRRPCCTY